MGPNLSGAMKRGWKGERRRQTRPLRGERRVFIGNLAKKRDEGKGKDLRVESRKFLGKTGLHLPISSSLCGPPSSVPEKMVEGGGGGGLQEWAREEEERKKEEESLCAKVK